MAKYAKEAFRNCLYLVHVSLNALKFYEKSQHFSVIRMYLVAFASRVICFT